jgi:hypothetical protein
MSQVVLFGDSALKFSRPLSIYKLASHLRDNGVSCTPVWAWRYVSASDFYKICKKFLSSETQVVGISTTLLGARTKHFWGISDSEMAIRFKLIRKLAPNAKLVAGGSQLPEVPIEQIPLSKEIDLFVTGQGENSLLAIVKEKRVKTLQPSPPIVTQDLYPYNDFVNTMTKFGKQDCIIPGEAMGYEFARGCIFKCSFCTYELTGKNRNDYNKSVDTITQELKHNYDQFGITHYNALDDLLNDSEEKVNAILDIAERLPFKLTYSAFVRLDMLRRFPTMATKLQQSGLIGAFMGIETVNDASGRAVGKGLGKNRINEALAMLDESWKNSVVTEASFILGLPEDTPDTKNQLFEWLQEPLTKRTIHYINVNSLGINSYRKLSDIDKDPSLFGYTIDRNLLWNLPMYSQAQASEDSKWVTRKYYSGRKYNTFPRIDVFTLPYLLSITDCRSDILNVILNDHSTIWNNNEEWLNWTDSQFTMHRDKYINNLLGR